MLELVLECPALATGESHLDQAVDGVPADQVAERSATAEWVKDPAASTVGVAVGSVAPFAILGTEAGSRTTPWEVWPTRSASTREAATWSAAGPRRRSGPGRRTSPARLHRQYALGWAYAPVVVLPGWAAGRSPTTCPARRLEQSCAVQTGRSGTHCRLGSARTPGRAVRGVSPRWETGVHKYSVSVPQRRLHLTGSAGVNNHNVFYPTSRRQRHGVGSNMDVSDAVRERPLYGVSDLWDDSRGNYD